MDYMLDPNYRGHLKTVASHLIPSLSVFNTSGGCNNIVKVVSKKL